MAAGMTARVFYVSTWIGIKAGCLAVRFLPRRWLFWFSDLAADIGFYCCRDFRTRSIKNLAVAFGERASGASIDEIARRSLRNFSRSCIEIALALEASDDELRGLMSVTGSEHLEAALAKGAGAIVLSAHLGNFFLVGSRLAVDGYKVSVLVNPPKDSRLAELMDRYRLQIGQRTIRARPKMKALEELHQSLRRNEVAVVIADEYRRTKGIAVSLFDRTVIARRGPATVALRTGAAIVPACMIRQLDGTLKLIIEPELKLDRSAKSRAQIEANIVRITEWLERTVRVYPDQWNWMNIRWSTAREHETAAQKPAHQPM
jgi:KDO2-lipid IV(A) lauroyltransferase